MADAGAKGRIAALVDLLIVWLVTLSWAGGSGYIAFASGLFGPGSANLVQKGVFAAIGIGVAVVIRLVLGWLSRKWGSTGMALGYAAAIPPSVQVGMLVAGIATAEAAKVSAQLAVPAFFAGFFAVALAIALTGALIGLALETALRAVLRMIPDSFPWFAFARTAVLLLVLAGVAAYALQRAGYFPEEPEVPEVSAWIEREKALFADVVAADRHETLVLPVQAEGKSFDRAERALMMRILVRRIEERTGARLADPTLVSRALDARARTIDPKIFQRLAERSGASTVIESRVRRSNDNFEFQAQVWKRAGDSWQVADTKTLKRLPYGDREPAWLALRMTADALLDDLKIAKGARQDRRPPDTGAGEGPNDLLAYAQRQDGTAEERAARIQLFASLHKREDIDADSLWVRSLIALDDAPDSPTVRRLEARAYLHLNRRPYALERLGEPAAPADRALRAALDGDAPAMEKAVDAMQAGPERIMSEIELADLYSAYQLNARLLARRPTVLEGAQNAYAHLLAFRLSAPAEWFSANVHGEVASLVGAKESRWRDVLRWLYWAYWLPDPRASSVLEMAAHIERTYGPLWRSHAAEWSGAPAGTSLAEWDYFDLLFAANRAAAVKALTSVHFNQGLSGQARRDIEAVDRVFGGYPWFTYLHAAALDKIGTEMAPSSQLPTFSRSSALALAAYRWEGGETDLSSAAEHYIFERKYEKYDDEPIPWHRSRDIAPAREYVDRITYSKAEIDDRIAEARRRLAYTDRFTKPLRELVSWLRRAGDREGVQRTVADNLNRFAGAESRVRLLDQIRDAGASSAEVLPLYVERMELDPESWDTRWRVASLHMEGGQPKEAQRILLEYPPFHRPAVSHDIVRLSNAAYLAGAYLHNAGETSLAVPLFQLSAKMQTGSADWMHSLEMLALGAKNFRAALESAKAQVMRYNDSGAGMRYALYLAMLGRREEAQQTLIASLGKFDDEAVWTAAFIAHRMWGLEGPEAEKWLAQAAVASGRDTYFNAALRERHAFMLGFVDRAPSGEAMAHLKRVIRANNGSWFYSSIAEGYAALQERNYGVAAEKLRRAFDDIFNIGLTRHQQLVDLLPYMTLALSRSGRRAEADAILERYSLNLGADSDYLIARALLEGGDGRHEEAAATLRRAFLRLPRLSTRTFFGGYVLLDACEVLLRESGNEVYRELIQGFAHRLQVSLPNPWAAAFEAKYARDLDDRQLAIAAASILDPRSPRITQVPQSERDALRRAVTRHDSILGLAARAGALEQAGK